MLAEKFFLVLETLISHASDHSDDKAPRHDQQGAARPDEPNQTAAQEAGSDNSAQGSR